MVEVKFIGRLGNQLFQYAFIYAAAKKLNTRFYIDSTFEGNYLTEYFYLKFDPLHTLDKYFFGIQGFKNIFRIHLKKGFYRGLRRLLNLKPTQISLDIAPELEMRRLRNNLSYEGYFQSEKYFSGYQTDIKKIYQIKKVYVSRFLNISKNLPEHQKLITVHIRRGDYLSGGIILPVDYYHRAIKSVNEPGNLYVIISDDPAYAAAEFHYLENVHISKETEIVDLQYLIHADCCILSNSTFSWWGAYLNQRNAKVIAPKNWLGVNNEEWPHSVLLNEWIKM